MANNLNDRVGNLSSEQLELLNSLLAEEGVDLSESVILPQNHEHKAFPLSYAQQRMWFLNQLDPLSAAYHISGTYRLTGRLDVPALAQSLRAIVRRHATLRTVFIVSEGTPQQVILQEPDLSLPVIDLRHLPQAEKETAALERIATEREEPFDLTRDLMIRILVLRLGANEYILSIVTHHIASDGWSMAIFHRELTALYAAYSSGSVPNLAALPIQYADFAAWQRKWLQGERQERQLDYWRQELADLPPLQLPTDRKRRDVMTFRGASERFTLEAELVEKLREIALEQGTTLHTVLLAVYAVLLSRTIVQDDIAIGVPVAGRIRTELEPLIGFFVNTLVIRAQLQQNPSFRTLLQDTKLIMLAALDHQDIPFEKLVEQLEPERHLNRNPLIATTFQLHELPQANFTLSNLAVESVEIPNLHAKFDMSCSLITTPDGLVGHWRYATDLFSVKTIQRMIGHFKKLLMSIVEQPDCKISLLPILTDDEHHLLLSDWGIAAPVSTLPVTLVHQLVELQAVRTPNAVAVFAADQQLTYRELNQRANQVAYRLREFQVGPEVKVGLFVDRTPETIIGLLGILKAGGAFVPLDTAAPPARLCALAEDAGLQLVLTDTKHLSDWPAATIPILCLDDAHWTTYPTGPDPIARASEDNAAYILYTSGSTGKPKGVIIEHRQLVSYVSAAVAQYGMSEGGNFAVVQPLTFDSCQTMIFPALGWGGTLHLISYEWALDAAALSAYFRHHGIDFLKIVPRHLRALLMGQEPHALLPRRGLIIGGETLHWDLVEELQALQPSCAIWNSYGPTETTVAVLTYPVSLPGNEHRPPSATVPLGRPLPGVRIFILDAYGNPVPIGVQGEIYIGGSSVARGYLNRPEETEARFLADQISGEVGGRLYRSGDFARWLPDGSIEFLGRNDDQIKIRGIRVELGEIEAVLGNYPDTAECHVLLRDDDRSDSRIVAYLSPVPESELVIRELDAYMRASLPEIMIPAAYVVLENLPRTMHGKINRSALPAPDASARLTSIPYIAPRSPEEEIITTIWREVLRKEQVGIHDNFFELGGHSLLAAQIMSRIERQLHVYLPLRTLFEHPTIAGIANAMVSAASAAKSDLAEEQDEFLV